MWTKNPVEPILPVIGAQEYVRFSRCDSPRLRDYFRRFDAFYAYHSCDMCLQRRQAYSDALGRPLSECSSMELCLLDRYTACVSVPLKNGKDGVTIHMCDFVPIVLGSRLDRRIRSDFWRRCDRDRCESLRCDRLKQGLVVLNKNLYHITTIMVTNNNVAHVYRKSNKQNVFDSRVYFYDRNFRGNMFYFQYNVVLLPCRRCVVIDGGADVDNGSSCDGKMRSVVVEELYLRNCFKQDYMLLRRFCWSSNGGRCPSTTHRIVRTMLERFVRQYEQKCAVVVSSSPSTIRPNDVTDADDDVDAPLASLGHCRSAVQRCLSVFAQRGNDVSLRNDLRNFIVRTDNLNDGECRFLKKINVNTMNNRDTSVDLMCNCSTESIRAGFEDCLSHNTNKRRPSRMTVFVDNLEEFKKISDSCFCRDNTSRTTDRAKEDKRLASMYTEQLYVLYIYMRQVIVKNEDIDQLCNKCVFDGPILYNKLLHQLREYLTQRVPFSELTGPMVETLVSRYRQLALTGNLYMLISSKTNIRVELANDMKRSLKLSVKREKMQQTEYTVASSGGGANSGPTNNTRSADIFTGVQQQEQQQQQQQQKLRGRTTKSGSALDDGDDDYDDELDDGLYHEDLDGPGANDKCDFVVLSKAEARKTKNLRTEYDVENRILYLASCNSRDPNVRQLITYSSNYLLQNVCAAHFSDLEYIFETIKRPSVANQHNSIKCSFMPRGAFRFLSYHNMGNLSVAGRTLNICSRNMITYFIDYNRIVVQFQRWLVVVYERIVSHCSSLSSSKSFHRTTTTTTIATTTKPIVEICQEHRISHCHTCFRCVLINEMPFVSVRVDRRFEPVLFFLVKRHWPAAQCYRKMNNILGITLSSGIVMIPMTIVSTRSHPRIHPNSVLPLANDVWTFCDSCSQYFPFYAHDRASNVVSIDPLISRMLVMLRGKLDDVFSDTRDGGIPICERHVWFSSNDLEYYESELHSKIGPPFVYEFACHGLLLNSTFMHATDISKLNVSISASRRRLRTACTLAPERELEMLVDQNSRTIIRSWESASDFESKSVPRTPDSLPEPLNSIVEVPDTSMFRCFFMFGDYLGFNTEDAYVFDSRSRPLFDNVVQLKMNFYRNDKSSVSADSLLLNFDPSVTVRYSGADFYLGRLASNHRLSFGSTFVHVKTVHVSEHLWVYKFYYVNNASYLRADEPVFAGGPSALKFVDADDEEDDAEPLSAETRAGRSTLVLDASTAAGAVANAHFSFERVKRTRNGRIVIRCQMTSKQLRFLVTIRGIRNVVKWQNNCGNKGVSTCVDLSDFYTERGGRVHAIVSAYGKIGRKLEAQLLEQMSCAGTTFDYANGSHLLRVFSRSRGGRQVGWGGYGNFFFSCDSPHDSIIVSSPSYGNNATRMCNMTYYAAIGNNLSTWIGNRSANHVNYRNNPINGMPLNLSTCLSVYHFYNRQMYMKRLLLREYRKKRRDHDEMYKRGIRTSLPLSIVFPRTRKSIDDLSSQ